MSCELCELFGGDIRTRLYYLDSTVIVVDCLACGGPMMVLGKHGEATEWEVGYMEGILNALFLFGGIRREARRVPDHLHWHLTGEVIYVGGG